MYLCVVFGEGVCICVCSVLGGGAVSVFVCVMCVVCSGAALCANVCIWGRGRCVSQCLFWSDMCVVCSGAALRANLCVWGRGRCVSQCLFGSDMCVVCSEALVPLHSLAIFE